MRGGGRNSSKVRGNFEEPIFDSGHLKKVAFTLAEVLITLGIIGIVAAMTMPTLIQKHRKSVVETSLKKFYTTVNQAINLSIVENGETKYWKFPPANTPADIEQFYDKYFKKYIKAVKTEQYSANNAFVVYFSDGSGVKIRSTGQDWYYCLKGKDLKKAWSTGKNCFLFGFYPNYPSYGNPYTVKNFRNKGVEPYISGSKATVGKDEDGNPIMEYVTEENIHKTTSYAKMIQLNGWRIPENYPIKF